MDIKKEITKVVEKITKDEKLMEQFKKDPVKAVESVIGVDLPDDMINKVIEGVKAKISVDKIGDIAKSVLGMGKKQEEK